jgi:hypothetical protein
MLNEIQSKLAELRTEAKRLSRAQNILYNCHCYDISANTQSGDVSLSFVFKDKNIQAKIQEVLNAQIDEILDRINSIESRLNTALAGFKVDE